MRLRRLLLCLAESRSKQEQKDFFFFGFMFQDYSWAALQNNSLQGHIWKQCSQNIGICIWNVLLKTQQTVLFTRELCYNPPGKVRIQALSETVYFFHWNHFSREIFVLICFLNWKPTVSKSPRRRGVCVCVCVCVAFKAIHNFCFILLY